MDFARNSESEDASWQVEHGYATKVAAGALSAEHIGRGVIELLHHDFRWLYLSGFTPRADGGVDVEYLTVERLKVDELIDGNVRTVVSGSNVKKHIVAVPATVEITISNDPVSRPVGKRVTAITTTTMETLEDELA
jgi:hypothetical protein